MTGERRRELAARFGVEEADIQALLAEQGRRRVGSNIAVAVVASALVLASGAVFAGVPTRVLALLQGAGPPLPGEAVPRQIPYRGYLERNGSPVQAPSGLGLVISLIPSDGGTPWAYGATVPVVGGNFSVELGDSSPIPSWVFEDPGVALMIAVEGETLQGSQRLLTVPFSQRSARAAAGSDLESRLVPSGTIIAFGGNATPSGWLVCDGSPIRASDRPELFAAIRTTWGDGSVDATGTPVTGYDFNLPDLRGRFLRGVNGLATGPGRDPGDGRFDSSGKPSAGVGSLQLASFLRHDHGDAGVHKHLTAAHEGSDSNGWGTGPSLPFGFDYRTAVPNENGNYTQPAGDHTHSAEGGSETRPVNSYVRFLIKS